jgi:hypothetical protein
MNSRIEGGIMCRTSVQVCGDPTIDWMLSMRNKLSDVWVKGRSSDVKLSSQAGGFFLTTNLLSKLIVSKKVELNSPEFDTDLLNKPKDNSITHIWTVWQPCEKNEDCKSFRISEWCQKEEGKWDYKKHKLKGNADLLIIEDSGLGFRNCRDGWPEALLDDKYPPQILLKMSGFGGAIENKLFDYIINTKLASRTTLLTSIDDLRKCSVKIGMSLSWEKIFDEICEAVYSSECNLLADCNGRENFQRVIVTIGTSGAVIIDDQKKVLIFDRSGQECDYEKQNKGQVIGYNTCVIGALASAWSIKKESTDWIQAVCDGIGLARILHKEGYKSCYDGTVTSARPDRHLEFPYEQLVNEYNKRSFSMRVCSTGESTENSWDLGVFVKNASGVNSNSGKLWTILEKSVLGEDHNANVKDAVYKYAKQIVIEGVENAIRNVPVEKINFWKSADRYEIEGVRSVKNAMSVYKDCENMDIPMSVAVFGPPGAGKSFAIKQIAHGLGIAEDAQLTFNLSQFESPQELAIAFHKIRDLKLKKKTPLVFWDEFDSSCEGKKLGWLRYFLVPMQDGEFTEKGVVHPLGGAIFVFAGGTKKSFAEFCKGDSEEEAAAKKKDFISRLRAYIDVRGPNGDPDIISDGLYLIRRACLLNSILERNAKHLKNNGKFSIDEGVINALLNITKYNHGARSMEAIVKMSSLEGKEKYEISCVPPEHLLEMYVDADEFSRQLKERTTRVLNIGITGHVKLNPNCMNELRKGIESAENIIEKSFGKCFMNILTPLARGGDRLVAEVLLKINNSRLIAVLPFDKNEYMKDFCTSEHKNVCESEFGDCCEFKYWLTEHASEIIEMPGCPNREDAYDWTGHFIVDKCDVLIAVWDGEESNGKGGTADIVKAALDIGKPVFHVWAENCKQQEKESSTLSDKYGIVRWANFPRSRDNWSADQ